MSDKSWKSKAENLLKRAFDDQDQYEGGIVYFAGEKHVTFLITRELLKEMQDVIDRKEGSER